MTALRDVIAEKRHKDMQSILQELSEHFDKQQVRACVVITSGPNGETLFVNTRDTIESLGLLERAKQLLADDDGFEPLSVA